MRNVISWKDFLVIGFMLFALFFGAGNLVFPPMLGQLAGTNVWTANFGFLLTGVGLPLICVVAFGFSGKEDLLSLTRRVHPIFSVVYTTVLYMTIGPFFAMPRTGSVSFEVGIKPYMPESFQTGGLLLFTIIYFGVSCLISLYPSRIIDIVGKILTPSLIVFLTILAVAGIAQPIGPFQAPRGDYDSVAFFNGVQEGYLTMDALASFVFGIIVIDAIRSKGASTKRQFLSVCFIAGMIAAIMLAVIYSFLSYLGASTVAEYGYLSNGGSVLTIASQHYFGTFGGLLLGGIVLLACLTTSIGLTTSCSTYLHKLLPIISYRTYAIGMSVFSMIMANVGLNELISISVPVLKLIYPLAVVLIALTFLHPLFGGLRSVYYGSLLTTFIISLIDIVSDTSVPTLGIHDWFSEYLPLYDKSLGWLLPAILGGLFGLLIGRIVLRR